MVHAGDGQFINPNDVKTLTIPEVGDMIALKKFSTGSPSDFWLVTGNVEVIS